MGRKAKIIPEETIGEDIFELLPCTLTEDERLSRGAEIASCWARIEAIDAERKAKMLEWRELLKGEKQKIELFSKELCSNTAIKRQKCALKVLKGGHMASVIRLDTGEVLRTRPLTLQERQTQLPFEKSEAVQ